jgi:hypothetical protein
MAKNKNNALKGGYKYKQIMRRFGKKNNEPVRKVIRRRDVQSIVNTTYTSNTTGVDPIEIEYTYVQAPPPKPKVVPKPGIKRGEG